jgi:mono/diheme cytochrome c family protein
MRLLGRYWRPWPLVAALAAGCDLPGQPKAADRPVRADQVLDFQVLYRHNCAGCHGADGKLGPAPPLNDPTFLAIVPDAVLSMVIAEGRPGTPMPAFSKGDGGPLTDAQVKALAEGIKPRWGKARPPEGPVPPYSLAEGGEKERGGQVFGRACAPCHGANGEGAGEGDHRVGPIADRAFLALISDQALRRYAITGRPDLGMPNFAGKAGRSKDFRPLTSPEINDLVALLASWRQGGTTDITRDLAEGFQGTRGPVRPGPIDANIGVMQGAHD